VLVDARSGQPKNAKDRYKQSEHRKSTSAKHVARRGCACFYLGLLFSILKMKVICSQKRGLHFSDLHYVKSQKI
jgi:hypothetical protein